ncbi:hypothetical protein A6R68_17588, partial [Neotoma lepida]
PVWGEVEERFPATLLSLGNLRYWLLKSVEQTTRNYLFAFRTMQYSEVKCKFTCTSGKCLYLGSLVCNQQNDCGDNSDEENCLLVTEHPPPGIFNLLQAPQLFDVIEQYWLVDLLGILA